MMLLRSKQSCSVWIIWLPLVLELGIGNSPLNVLYKYYISMYIIYTLYIHHIYTIYTLYIHFIHIIYTLYIHLHCIYIIFTLYIHYIYIIYIHIIYIYGIYILFTLHIHYIYIIYTHISYYIVNMLEVTLLRSAYQMIPVIYPQHWTAAVSSIYCRHSNMANNPVRHKSLFCVTTLKKNLRKRAWIGIPSVFLPTNQCLNLVHNLPVVKDLD